MDTIIITMDITVVTVIIHRNKHHRSGIRMDINMGNQIAKPVIILIMIMTVVTAMGSAMTDTSIATIVMHTREDIVTHTMAAMATAIAVINAS
ncbi:MAG: hypothetical protein C5B54_07115 [Acidobacteria bacterium]|nr:MAG: hypothetical protein C5B54_07115 [Acidobacteriota bacterium]